MCGEQAQLSSWTYQPQLSPTPNSRGRQDTSRSPYLPIWCGDEAQKFIHVAHSQPVHKQLHQRLHLLGMEEVSDHLGNSAASRPGPGLGKDTKLNTHSRRNRMATQQLSPQHLTPEYTPGHSSSDLALQHLGG